MIKHSRRAWYVLAATATAVTSLVAVSGPASAGTQVVFPVQAMGNLQVGPGATLEAGYAFQMPGHHPAARVILRHAVATFDATCVSGTGGGVITVSMRSGSSVDPANDGGDWFPASGPPGTGYQGSVIVPDLCGGGQVSLAQGGSFTANLTSSDATDPVTVHWHYAAAGQGGPWSSNLSVTPGPGGPNPPPAIVILGQPGGNLQVDPGATLEAGYAFQMSGNHPAARVIFQYPVATFDATCVSGTGGGVIMIRLGRASYVDPLNDGGDWFPSSDPFSLASYQGSVTVPDLCDGGPVSLAEGGTLLSGLRSSDATDPVQVRWHYAIAGPAGGIGGGWSGNLQVIPGPGGPPPPPAPPQPTQIIVKVDLAGGYTINDITSAFPVTVDKGGLASVGIYLVTPTLPPSQWPPNELQQLATQINGYKGADYAEVNLPVRLADTEFYAWPYGRPTPDGRLPSTFTGQPIASTLQLAAAHAQTQGAGVTVAVLDTGADPVPALRGHLLPGWNYLADNSDTRDVASRAGDKALGHGTFVSGLISLVAPQAKILPEKVLNSNGYGTVYGAAQAILGAVAAGANVINLSFGTAVQPSSNLLQQAIQQAQAAGAVVVAAAGNEGTNVQEYPAAWSQSLSVAATTPVNDQLTNFSNWGGWVDVGAPGEQVVGPMPGGGYDTWAGTSMAAPFVAGQAALIRSLVPAMQPAQVLQAIEGTTDQLPQNPIHSGAINIVASLAFAQAHP